TAVGIGFYGNSETNDGVYQLLYALDNANHTLTGIDALVAGSTQRLQGGLEQHLGRLSEVLAPRADYLQTLKFLQQLAAGVVLQLSGLPSWHGVSAQLTALAACAAYVEYYRWLAYLLFFILVLTVCLLGCLGLAKRSRCLLAVMLCCGLLTLVLSWASTALDAAAAVGTSDFCVAPDKFIMNQTESEISAEVAHYYLYCEQSLSNPFQQVWGGAEPLGVGARRAVGPNNPPAAPPPPPPPNLFVLPQDYLDALIGICYDGVEGLLYLVLFSLLVAASFSTIICATPRAWKHLAGRDRDYDDMDEEDPFNPQARRIAAHNPARGQLRSFCSYSSSLGSQSSLHPPAQTISNAPVSEYMNQAVLFGGNPRYENVPLIGRGSPPPTYSPSMRATYLSVTDEHVRPFNTEFPA
ncbi:TTYH2 protein, partial [Asarcornis scutulata]|nr:TTYH2 protein [Asarcornis scutulata]